MPFRKILTAVGGIVVAGLLMAQTFPSNTVVLPLVPNVSQGDYVQVLPGGQAYVGNKYAPAGQVAGSPSYVNGGVATTGFSYTFANGQVNYFIQPAGTLATGTLTTEPNPGDGKRECFLSTQTQTALTWSANTGQSISNAPTAGVAMTPICITYSAASATWYRSP